MNHAVKQAVDYVRRADERGRADFGWLDSRHSFSFGSYYDPDHMGLSSLRVINDDRVSPGAGFDTHGHRDMEIISYILSGAVRHEDSMGNQYVVPAGDIQVMSAGTGVMHSEFNASMTEPVHFLQIWIEPDQPGLAPRYDQARVRQHGPLTPLVTSDGRDGSLMMHQNASVNRLVLAAGESISLDTVAGVGYLHMISGEVLAEGTVLGPGDALGVASGRSLGVFSNETVEALWFELPEAR